MKEQPPGGSGSERAKRSAEALRANLLRRKEQARERAEDEKDKGADTPSSTGE